MFGNSIELAGKKSSVVGLLPTRTNLNAATTLACYNLVNQTPANFLFG